MAKVIDSRITWKLSCGHVGLCKNVRKIVNKRSENRRFQPPHSHLTSPLQRTPANISINLILTETTFHGLHFCRWQFMGSLALQIFEQFCPKAGDANRLVAEPETDFNAKWPFKVIYFGITEQPLRGYIAQYNKCGLRCEGSEDIASEKNRHFRPRHSHLMPEPPRISA